MFSSIKLVLFALAGIAVTSHAQVSFPIEPPTLKVGDTWKYQRTDLWRNQVLPGNTTITVDAINDRGYSFRGTNREGAAFNDNFNLDLNWTQTVRGEVQTHGVMKWPLLQGGTSNYKNNQTRGANEWTNDASCSYSGIEKIKVPAGEFDTVKISCRSFWNTTNGSGSNENVSWYSPAAKRVIKQQSKFYVGSRLDTQTLDELVEFKLN